MAFSNELFAAKLNNLNCSDYVPRAFDPSSTRSSANITSPGTPMTPADLDVDLSRSASSICSNATSVDSLPTVCVIGVGYVGLHLVQTFGKTHEVIAYDVSAQRLRDVKPSLEGLSVRCTAVATDLAAATYFLISVPSILSADNKSINTSYLRSAVKTINQHAPYGATVVVESSVAVGMTRQLLGELAITRGFKVGMSPERVDPGRTFPAFQTVPKIISGLDQAALESIKELYDHAFDNVVTVSSPEVAEMTKLYENCQRMICGAYANEMADACVELGIDPWEVAEAAATKPFGYLPFRPGPGIGGHCIPVNPFYIFSTSSMPILEHATTVTHGRPAQLADRLMAQLGAMVGETEGPRRRIVVVGMGFKRGQNVLSHSPGLGFANRLQAHWAAHVEFADPLVEQAAIPSIPRFDLSTGWTLDNLETYDAIVVAVDQPGVDLSLLPQLRTVVVQNWTADRF